MYISTKGGKWLYSLSVMLLTTYNIIICDKLPLMYIKGKMVDFEIVSFFDLLSK